MIFELKMPRLDEDMLEGTVTRWLKKEGDPVRKGEPVVEIETQKVNFEVEATGDGVLRAILARAGESLPINAVMAVIADPADDIGAYLKPKGETAGAGAAAAPAPSPAAAPAPAGPEPVGEGERIPISPVAKKLAQERGLDIRRIRGTGPGGRVTKEDVLGYTPEETKGPLPAKATVAEVLPLTGMRKTIAERLTTSWQNSPRAEHFMTADVTEFMKMREKNGAAWESRHGVKPTVNDAVVAASAKALRAFPMVNAALLDGRIEQYAEVNVSIAVALEKGLITPVVRRADERDIFAIARETRRLAELVRTGSHTKETLSGSTFTVTNLGMFDVDFFIPVINPPESAILSIGRIERRAVVIDEAIAIRSVMVLCCAFDHRVLDGAVVARFLKSIKQTLEDPRSLFPEAQG